MILNTINPNLVELREPGEPPPLESVAWDEIRIAGTCVKGESYDVELWTKKNYSGERKCYNAGEKDEQLPLGQKIRSIQINDSAAVKLFAEPNFEGRNLCLKTSYPDLYKCNLKCGWGCIEWYDSIESLKIIPRAECLRPGFTLDEIGNPTKEEIEKCEGF